MSQGGNINSKLYKKIAKKYGVSVEEVKREMEKAIAEAADNGAIDDLKAKNRGKTPTPDQFITEAAAKVKTPRKIYH